MVHGMVWFGSLNIRGHLAVLHLLRSFIQHRCPNALRWHSTHLKDSDGELDTLVIPHGRHPSFYSNETGSR